MIPLPSPERVIGALEPIASNEARPRPVPVSTGAWQSPRRAQRDDSGDGDSLASRYGRDYDGGASSGRATRAVPVDIQMDPAVSGPPPRGPVVELEPITPLPSADDDTMTATSSGWHAARSLPIAAGDR